MMEDRRSSVLRQASHPGQRRWAPLRRLLDGGTTHQVGEAARQPDDACIFRILFDPGERCLVPGLQRGRGADKQPGHVAGMTARPALHAVRGGVAFQLFVRCCSCRFRAPLPQSEVNPSGIASGARLGNPAGAGLALRAGDCPVHAWKTRTGSSACAMLLFWPKPKELRRHASE